MRKIVPTIVASFILFVPFLVSAQNFNLHNVCDGTIADPCTFADFIELIKRAINALTLIATFIATAMFAWAGITLLTSFGNEGAMKKAKSLFTAVLIGYLWILAAWLIIYTITSVLLKDDGYSILGDPK